MLDPNVVFDKLAGFQTADEMADYFKSEGIHGHMQVETQCPIAIYFYTHTQMPLVGVSEIISISNYDQVDAWQKECTKVMKDFISKFDEAEYPDLIQCTEDEYCVCSYCRSEYYR